MMVSICIGCHMLAIVVIDLNAPLIYLHYMCHGYS